MEKNFYVTLRLRRSATPEDITSRYRKLAMVYHPKKDNSIEAAIWFEKVAEAYEVLINPRRREVYDKLVDAGVVPDSGDFVFPTHGGGMDTFISVFGTDDPYKVPFMKEPAPVHNTDNNENNQNANQADAPPNNTANSDSDDIWANVFVGAVLLFIFVTMIQKFGCTKVFLTLLFAGGIKEYLGSTAMRWAIILGVIWYFLH